MFRSREQAQYDAELEALKEKERQLYKSQAEAMAREKQQLQLQQQQTANIDNRELPLAYWLGWAAAEKTRGSARLDLVRPRFQAVEPGSLFRTARAIRPDMGMGGANPQAFGGRYDRYEQHRPFFGFGQGARIKVMRHIDFGVPQRFRRQRGVVDSLGGELTKKGFFGQERTGPLRDREQPVLQREPDFGAAVSSIQNALKDNFKPPEKPWFDFGAGVNLELDEGSLQPTVRLKVKDFFSIKLLPEPMFKIQKRLRFGPSTMGVRVNYELPLIEARNLWAPPARLMLRVDNHMGGLRVGPGGADFDESVLQLGNNTSVRTAMSVDFPKSLPLEGGERFFGWRARRLGIKTRW